MSSAIAVNPAVTIKSLNFQLEDIQLEGDPRFGLEDFSDQSTNEKFLSTCRGILDKLRFYDGKIPIISETSDLTEIYHAIEHRKPHFQANSDNLQYRLLSLLCTHLQAERLHFHTTKMNQRKETAESKGRLAFQLDKLCKTLNLETEFDDANDILNSISSHIEPLVKNISSPTENSSSNSYIPKLLEKDLGRVISSGDIPSDKKAIIDNIADMLQQDYIVRRQMLLKRLDVTIQSFLWGDRAKDREEEILTAVNVQRRHLTESTPRYSLEDALSAPHSMLHELSAKVTSTYAIKSVVQRVIIGSVPDRGGRANETRPKPSDIGRDWKGGRGRGGKGGGGNSNHGGGRGNGRGGGEGGGKGNNGGGRVGKNGNGNGNVFSALNFSNKEL
eukprot:gene2712-5339_t